MNLIENTFSNYKIEKSQVITLYRNADINTEDYLADNNEDYREYMKIILKKRNRLQAVALKTNKPLSKTLESFLRENLSIKENQPNLCNHSSFNHGLCLRFGRLGIGERIT